MARKRCSPKLRFQVVLPLGHRDDAEALTGE